MTERRFSGWRHGLRAALLLALAAAAAPVSADVIQTRPLNRKFPSGQFCPLPLSIEFTSPTDRVTVEFKALRFVNDEFGDPQYTEQLIDNVMLAPTAVHNGNFGPPPDDWFALVDCYTCGGVTTTASYFHFTNIATLPLRELFDVDPATTGWDMTNGAYWNTIQGAPRRVEQENDQDFSAGCLLLGDQGSQPDPYGTTSKEITGLTAGASYTLSAWWSANISSCQIDPPPIHLTITISAPNQVGVDEPVAQSNWLGPAIPNPAPGSTHIAYRLSERGNASLVIYDAQGRRVRGLFSGTREAGEYAEDWDGLSDAGQRVASGLYFYRLETPRHVLWGKVVTTR